MVVADLRTVWRRLMAGFGIGMVLDEGGDGSGMEARRCNGRGERRDGAVDS